MRYTSTPSDGSYMLKINWPICAENALARLCREPNGLYVVKSDNNQFGLRGAEDRIDLAVVMGGWPDDVAAAIKRAKPWMPVYKVTDQSGNSASIFGNLSGFQIWAEQNAKQE